MIGLEQLAEQFDFFSLCRELRCERGFGQVAHFSVHYAHNINDVAARFRRAFHLDEDKLPAYLFVLLQTAQADDVD